MFVGWWFSKNLSFLCFNFSRMSESLLLGFVGIWIFSFLFFFFFVMVDRGLNIGRFLI